MANEVPRPRSRTRTPRSTGATEATEPTDFPRSNGAPLDADAETPPTPKASAPRVRALRANSLESKLEELFSAPALAFSLAGDDHCANIVSKGAPQMARAWAKLAQENAGVRRVLEQLLQGSAWGGVIYSTLIVALPIAAHHGAPVPFIGGLTKVSSRPGAGDSGFTWGDQPPSAPPAPVSPVAPVPPVDDAGPETPPVYVPGAPPGVVTVAHGPAAHSGAR